MFSVYGETTADGHRTINWKNLFILIAVAAVIALAIYFGLFAAKSGISTVPSPPDVTPSQPTPPPQPTIPPAVSQATPTPTKTSPSSTPATPPIISLPVREMTVKELIQLVQDPNAASTVESFLGKKLRITGLIATKDFFANGYVGFVCLAAEGDLSTGHRYVYAAADLYENESLRQKLLSIKENDRVVIEGIFFGTRPYGQLQLDKANVSSFILPPAWITTDVCGIKIEEIH